MNAGRSRGGAMREADFHYELPESLIAQFPLPERSASRLLELDADTGVLRDGFFSELPRRLRRGDLLVLNDTRVLPARLFGRKESGGRVEVLLERRLSPRRWLALVRASRRPRAGTCIRFESGYRARVRAWRGDLIELDLIEGGDLDTLLARHGHLPLPPYIKRTPQESDRARYQTVYAARQGAVAAPTAGLHFDERLLDALGDAGMEIAYLTLHVSAGTFRPLRGGRIDGHRLHAERLQVPPALCDAVAATRERGGRIVAVGTTTTRALESASASGVLQPCDGETDLFIKPGFAFRIVDLLITNFHLPRSTLLMLVCAFGGTRQVLAAYRHAVNAAYRFYSYGDAMLVTRGRG